MMTEFQATSYRRAKDCISQLPLHLRRIMTLALACGTEHLLSPDGKKKHVCLHHPFFLLCKWLGSFRGWKGHKIGVWVSESSQYEEMLPAHLEHCTELTHGQDIFTYASEIVSFPTTPGIILTNILDVVYLFMHLSSGHPGHSQPSRTWSSD